jgi:hypothetical protein
MMFILIADFFVEQIVGGGELNNRELVNILRNKGHSVTEIQSHLVTPEFIEQNKNKNFIVANFVGLHFESKQSLLDKNYVIYEHDHKYLKTRDPSKFENFLAPKQEIINLDFYKNAKAVFCQSKFHLEIVKKNTNLDNLINLSGNLWPIDALEHMKDICKTTKEDKFAVLQSDIQHKNTKDALLYCRLKEKEYNLVASRNYKEFLSFLGANQTFVFFPKTPETLSRVIVEARMMNMSIITNKMVGATKEDWYSLKGAALIDIVHNMRERIPNEVVRALS